MLVYLLKTIATDKNATPAQIVLSWLLAQKPRIVPMSGTMKLNCFEENAGAVNLALSKEDLQKIEAAYAKIEIVGARYSHHLINRVGR